MFKDLNRPEGMYGDHYDRMTRAKDRFVGQPLQSLTRWESDAVSAILLEELNKVLNNK